MSKKGRAKRIILSVTNDLSVDQRMHRVALTLLKSGAGVMLVGRKGDGKGLLSSRSYQTKSLRLFFHRSVFFYAEYNIRLFFFLLTRPADILVANDLDTLPANALAAFFKRSRLVYDSHEFFTGLPHLNGRPIVRSTWRFIERLILPKIRYSYTVSRPIADELNRLYGIHMKVVRNVPFYSNGKIHPLLRTDFGSTKIIVYQGSLNLGRGLKNAVKAMNYVDDAILLLIGSGDIETELRALVAEEHLTEKVIFTGKVPFELLGGYNQGADLGISLEEDNCLNNAYALPNKLFDYIQAGIPVLCSALPEMKKIVESYEIGRAVNCPNAESLAKVINDTLKEETVLRLWRENLKRAAMDLCWEKEESKLKDIYREAGLSFDE